MIRNEPVSVLHFCCEPVRGGAEEHMLLLLRKLDRRLFRLHLVCPPELLQKLGSDLPADVECFPLLLEQPTHVPAAWNFAKILRSREIDILHAHMFRASLAASPVACLCGVPVRVETAHVREHWRKGWIRGSFAVDRFAGWFVTRYIAVSRSTGDYLVREKRLPTKKVAVIANGCDLNRFHPDYPVRPELAEQIGIDPKQHRILAVTARLEPQKGHRVLLDALPAVVRRFSNLRVICAGDGQLRGELEQQSRVLGLADHVRFIGYKSDVRPWLALAEFTILPSFYEGLPLTAIESLSSGRTVVATAVDGTSEVIIDGQTGVTVPPGNSNELAAAILRLLESPATRDTLAAAGREWVVDRFSQERQVGDTERLYLNALQGRRRFAVSASVECGDHHVSL